MQVAKTLSNVSTPAAVEQPGCFMPSDLTHVVIVRAIANLTTVSVWPRDVSAASFDKSREVPQLPLQTRGVAWHNDQGILSCDVILTNNSEPHEPR